METYEEVDNETRHCLSLDASHLERLEYLTVWHFQFAREYSRSFKLLLEFCDATGFAPNQSHMHVRLIHDFLRRKTILERKLFDRELIALSEMPIYSAPGVVLKKKSSNKSADKYLRELLEEEKRGAEAEALLRDHFANSLTRLGDDRTIEVIKLRLGFELAKPLTLEEVGQRTGVTRERVRQIEKKNLERMERYALWDDIFRDKCTRLFGLYGPLLLVHELAEIDPWFRGFNLPKGGWQVFLKYFAGGLKVISGNKQLALTSIEDEQAVKDDIQFIEEGRRSGLSEDYLRSSLRESVAYLGGGGEYYAGTLLKTANHPIVVVEQLVRHVLEQSEGSLGVEDVLAYAYRNGRELKNDASRAINNALTRYAVPISRSPTKYVTRGSLGLQEVDLRQYCDSFYTYWLGDFSLARVFHGDEVLDWFSVHFGNSGTFKHQGVSSWAAVAPLHFDPEVRFAGNKLRVWLTEAWCGTQPTNIEDVIEELLRIRGEPMTTKEISEQMYKERGVGKIFQIHPTETVHQTTDSRWIYVGK